MKRRTFLDLAALSALAPVPARSAPRPARRRAARDPGPAARRRPGGSCRSTPRRRGCAAAPPRAHLGGRHLPGPPGQPGTAAGGACRRSCCSRWRHDLPAETAPLRRELPDAVADRRHAGRARQPRLRRGQALQDAPAGGGQPRGHRAADAHRPREAAGGRRLELVPALRGALLPAPGQPGGRARRRGAGDRRPARAGTSRSCSSPPAPRASRCSASWPIGSTHNHPPLKFDKPPTGWCSWYCFGPRVTAQQVSENLDFIAKQVPALRYVQIDDGYQSAMGDWLDTGKAFGGDVKGVLKQIRQRGFEPAIWVAPFVAEARVQGVPAAPGLVHQGRRRASTPASRCRPTPSPSGAGGAGPGTRSTAPTPRCRSTSSSLFRTMREQWGCTYFKLDANFWGAMHGGQLTTTPRPPASRPTGGACRPSCAAPGRASSWAATTPSGARSA